MFEIALAAVSASVVEVLEHQQLERLLRCRRRRDDLLQAVGLLGHDLVLAAGLGLELRRRWRRLALGLDARCSAVGLGLDDRAGLLGLGGGLERGARSASTRSASARAALGHGAVLRLLHRGLGLALARLGELVGLGLAHLELRLRASTTSACACASPAIALALASAMAMRIFCSASLTWPRARRRPSARRSSAPCPAPRRAPPAPLGLLDLRLALERGRLLADLLLLLQLGDAHGLLALGLAHADLAELVGVGDLHDALALRLGHADLAQLLLLGHVAAGLLHRLRRRLLADGLDVARLVVDVGDVHVDQHQADLLELRLERRLDAVQERVAVAVDLLDAHGRDHLPQLAEDDVLRLPLDLLVVSPSRRMAAFCRTSGSVPMATVNTLGTLDADVLEARARP